MANYVEELLLKVGIDTTKVAAGMKKATSAIGNGLKNLASSIVAPVAGAFAAISSGQFITDLANEAASMQRFGKLLGWTTEQMSEWSGAAANFGLDAEKITDIFTDFSDKASDVIVNDSGPFKELIERGLIDSFADASGKMKPIEEIIYEISDALKSLGETEGAGLAKRIGINDPQFITFMLQGSEALKKYREEAKKVGVYTDEDADQAKEFKKQMAELGREFKFILLPALRIILPIMKLMATTINFATKHWRAFIPVLAGAAIVIGVSLKNSIIDCGKALKRAFSTNWKLMAILGVLLLIGLALEDLYVWANGGESEFSGLWESIFGSAEEAQKLFKKISEFDWGPIAILSGLLLTLIPIFQLLEGVAAVFGTAAAVSVGWIIAAIVAVIAILAALYIYWDDIAKACSEAWATFCEWISSNFDSTVSFIQGLWESFCSNFTGLFDGAAEGVKEALGWIAEKCDAAAEKWNAFKGMLPSFGGGEQAAALATSAQSGNVTNTKQATQNNVYNINGNVSKETIDAARGNDSDWAQNFANSGNFGG